MATTPKQAKQKRPKSYDDTPYQDAFLDAAIAEGMKAAAAEQRELEKLPAKYDLAKREYVVDVLWDD